MNGTPFREFYEASPDAVIVIDPDGQISFANSCIEAMLGYVPSELIGKSHSFLLPERFRERHSEHVDRFLNNPSPRMMGSGMALAALCKDGSERLIEISLSPYHTPGGLVVIASLRDSTTTVLNNEGIESENSSLRDLLGRARNDVTLLLKQAGIDATERESATRLQRLLLEELHHRVKNMMTTVMAITSQSLRTAKSMDQGLAAIQSRLTAMGRAQDFMLRTVESGAQLSDVISSAIEPFESKTAPRFVVHDTPVDIGPEAVLPLTLSLNELCTNAVKYGALSNVSGRIDIAADVDEETKLFTLRWTETDGPPVKAPTEYSFGTRLLGALATQLHGKVRLIYEPSGVEYQLTIPLALVGALRN